MPLFLLLTNHGLIDHHSRNRFAVFLLLGRVNAVCFRVNSEAMNRVLNPEVFQLAVMLWIILMENRYSSAVARDINTVEAGIKFDDVWSTSHGQKGNRQMLV